MKNTKTFSKFILTPDMLVLFLFLLGFLVIGIIELFSNFYLGLGFIIFYTSIMIITLKERYNKWRKLYKNEES